MLPPGLRYDPTLAENEIRLMRIEASPQPDDLRFSLERHFRETAPRYIALSYACGNEPEIHEILIDNTVAKIRPNLWQALYHVTTEKEALDVEWQYIWCDAICINQPNLEEKSDQIRAMYNTYRQAEVVIAWLGIDRSGKYDGRAAEIGGTWKNHRNRIKTDLFREEVLPSDYLTRLWIVQEAVAARKFVPVFGRTRITKNHMAAARRASGILANLRLTETSELTRPFQILHLGFYHGFEPLLDKLWTPIQRVLPDLMDPNTTHLTQWLRFTRNSVCANPKDRIFSLLNLLPPREREVLNRFLPDYELSLERIQLITLAYIRHSRADVTLLKGFTERSRLEDAMTLLRVHSASLQDEICLKSGVSKAHFDATNSHTIWTWTHMLQHTKASFLGHAEGDEAWTHKRIHTLSMIGSQPLLGELRAQADLLKGKAWYIQPPDQPNEPEELGDGEEVR